VTARLSVIRHLTSGPPRRLYDHREVREPRLEADCAPRAEMAATSTGGSPCRRAATTVGTLRPVTRSTAAITLRTEVARPLPRLSGSERCPDRNARNAATWARARSQTWMKSRSQVPSAVAQSVPRRGSAGWRAE
jgi:hypothetical protein